MQKKLNDDEKELQFQQQMKNADKKKQLKKRKKLEKAKSRALFENKHKAVSIGFSVVVLSILSVSGYYLYQTVDELYDNYANTLRWEKKSEIPISTIDPETLYASDEDKKNRELYLQELNGIWNQESHSFVEGVNSEKIEKLKVTYESITSSKVSLDTTYQEVMTMWSVKQKLDDLFVDGLTSHRRLKRTSTLTSINNTLSESFDLISSYLIDSKYTLANQYYVEISELTDELINFQKLINEFDSFYESSQEQRKLVLKTEVSNVGYQKLTYLLSTLHYEWEVVDNVIKPVIEKSESVVALNEAELLSYNAYIADSKAKEDFSKYLDNYKKEKDRLLLTVVELPNFVGLTKEEAEKKATSNSLTLQVTYETTTDKSKHLIVSKQSVDTQKYKTIMKGSTIEITVYEYKQRQTSNSVNSSTNDDNSSSTSTVESDSSYSNNYSSTRGYIE